MSQIQHNVQTVITHLCVFSGWWRARWMAKQTPRKLSWAIDIKEWRNDTPRKECSLFLWKEQFGQSHSLLLGCLLCTGFRLSSQLDIIPFFSPEIGVWRQKSSSKCSFWTQKVCARFWKLLFPWLNESSRQLTVFCLLTVWVDLCTCFFYHAWPIFIII